LAGSQIADKTRRCRALQRKPAEFRHLLLTLQSNAAYPQDYSAVDI
jgi:hypothetical protein